MFCIFAACSNSILYLSYLVLKQKLIQITLFIIDSYIRHHHILAEKPEALYKKQLETFHNKQLNI